MKTSLVGLRIPNPKDGNGKIKDFANFSKEMKNSEGKFSETVENMLTPQK